MCQGKRSALANIMNAIAHNLDLPYKSYGVNLPKSKHYVLCLIDGLAYQSFLEHKTSTSFLSTCNNVSSLSSGFPSTTASCLTSLATGLDPIEHGIVGAAFQHSERYFSSLRWCYLNSSESKYKENIIPSITIPYGIWDCLKEHKINVNAIIPIDISTSVFTSKVFSAAKIYGYKDFSEITSIIEEVFKREERSFTYIYFGNLDLIGHIFGVDSQKWKDEYLYLDSFIQKIHRLVIEKATLLVTADHGMVNMSQSDMIDFNEIPALTEQTHLICGDIRARHIYLKPAFRDNILIDNWIKHLGNNFFVFKKEEAIKAELFGVNRNEENEDRIGDLIVISRGQFGLIDSSSNFDQYQSSWIGHHGANTENEQLIPLLIWN
ncbi:alkaline phosphatase family protein [Acinetobacter baumannii]|nr:alkaline phosphatase family protein [Acinetobacter baumannii]